MDDKTKGQEKYLQGLELAQKGLTPDEIAKELGLFNARAWSTMKAYHGRKGLAELAAPTTANDPEPAVILEGIDCERSEPRTSVVAQNDPAIMDAIKAKNSGALIGFTDPPQEMLDGDLTEACERAKKISDEIGLIATAGPGKSELLRSHVHKMEDTRYWPVPVDSKPRMTVRRVLAADGALVRYRVEGDLLQINSKGQKRAALEIDLSEARRMMDELNDFLEQVGV